MISMNQPEPFKLEVSDAVLDDLRDRLSKVRWPQAHDGPAWALGTSLPFMKTVRDYWLGHYDWRENEKWINGFSHHRVEIDEGRRLHYVIELGSGSSPRPLLMSHGWPGSFVELLHVIEPLAHPERFGGDAEDGFTVVVPSLPGYGFSDHTSRPTTPTNIASDFRRLMIDVLGFDHFLAHGGDWGSVITTRLGLEHADVVQAIHITMVGGVPDMTGPELTPAERAWIATDRKWRSQEGAYAALQGSKPQTVSFGLTDSPIGLAAWILEKFRSWTDPTSESVVPEPLAWDDLLNNVMVYWIAGISTANSLYSSASMTKRFAVSWDRRVTVPARLLLFPNDLSEPPPRSWAERLYARLTIGQASKGGHFPGLEQPALLADDIRNWFRMA